MEIEDINGLPEVLEEIVATLEGYADVISKLTGRINESGI